MKNLSFRKPYLSQLIILALVVFLSRVPFIGNGFGNDPDAWRIENTARSIALSGKYSFSRPPGYPVPELLYSLIWNASPIIFNGITALFSVGVFVFFALSLVKINCEKSLLGAVALVFIPVIYINSVNSMDYIWALFFITGSLYFALDNKYILAGVFLGLAIGCRITSAAMILPIGIIVYCQNSSRVKSIRTFIVSTFVIGLIVYIPVIYIYKFSFLTFSEHGYPFYLTIIKNTSIGVWGFLGSLVIIMAVILSGIRFRKIISMLQERDPIFLASVSSTLIYLLIYIRLPHESGYLIPLLPFVLLLFYKLLDNKWFTRICILLILSSFVLTLNNRHIYIAGPIIKDRQSRIEGMQFSNLVLDQSSRLEKNSIVVSGYYLPQLEWYLYKNPIDGVKFVELINPDELVDIRNNNETNIYYLPGIDLYNKNIYGINLSDFGGTPLLPGYNGGEYNRSTKKLFALDGQ